MRGRMSFPQSAHPSSGRLRVRTLVAEGCPLSPFEKAQPCMRTRIVLLTALWLFVATVAHAQPDAWVVTTSVSPFSPSSSGLRVIDMATGNPRAGFGLPTGGWGGTLSADGQFFFLGTTSGIAVYRTNPPEFLGTVGPPVRVDHIYASPSGRWVHVVGPDGYAVLDVVTGAIAHVECCTAPTILFTSDDLTRMHVVSRGGGVSGPVETVITAYPDDPGTPQRWQVVLPGVYSGEAAITETYLALTGTSGIVVLDPASGSERGRLSRSVASVALHGDTMVVAGYDASSHDQLAVYSLPALTLIQSVTPSAFNVGSFGLNRVRLSSDGAAAYWFRFVSIQGVTVSTVQQTVVDLTTGTLVRGGSIASRSFLGDFVLERAPACFFDVAESVTAPAEGGVVDIPVTSRGTCRPWTVPASGAGLSSAVLNPGPHTGSTTIRVFVRPGNGTDMPRFTSIAGHPITIEQATSVPGAVELAASVSDNRVTITWVPNKGTTPSFFVLRGAVRGSAPVPVVTLPGTSRTWTSPPLAPVPMSSTSSRRMRRVPARPRTASS